MALEDDMPASDVWSHLEPANRIRIGVILSEYVPEVFRLTRIIEHETGYTSAIGTNMLIDVLSHLGVLASKKDLSRVGQASQLSKIEEHLRRAIVEHPEEVVRDRLADIRERWLVYERECYPYRQAGTLSGAPPHRDLEDLRNGIQKLLESSRKAKPEESTWDESLDAAAWATEAAHKSVELADMLERCIGIAQTLDRETERDAREQQRDSRQNRQWTIGIVVLILTALFSAAAGYGIAVATKDDSKSTPTATPTATSPAKTATP